MKTHAPSMSGVAATLYAAFASLAFSSSLSAAETLPALHIDPSGISVSGLSSGGFMANQLGYAYSRTFRGVGVFAGGPYMCAGHSSYTACMYNAGISDGMLNRMQSDLNNWSGSLIDALSNVADQKVFMFVGTSDWTVGVNPMDAVQKQYRDNHVGSLEYVKRSGVSHVFPTDFKAAGNAFSCAFSMSPYIANCGYDGAKAVLSQFYGPLKARNNSPAESGYQRFDQTPYIHGNPGMSPEGWIYVPADCAAGAECKLHVALHGCQQNYDTIGDKFIKNTGYTRWADTNRIVVLFPQTRADYAAHRTPASGSVSNPNGCWDWIGWYGEDFARRSGTQMEAIKAMVDRVAGGGGGGGDDGKLPPPTGVRVSNPTDTTMTVTWNAVAGAAGYTVFRDGVEVGPARVAEIRYVDTGLAPATTYSWRVATVDDMDERGALSEAAVGTTTGTKAECFTSSNYDHTVAGRAHQSGSYALADGSNQNMGLWNMFVTTTLKRTGPDYYVIGSCR